MKWGIRKEQYKSLNHRQKKLQRKQYRQFNRKFEKNKKESLLKDQEDGLKRVQENYNKHKNSSLLQFVMNETGENKAQALSRISKNKAYWKNEYDYVTDEFENSIAYFHRSISKLKDPNTKHYSEWFESW